jgi:preprotein translocase subunit SecA
MIGALARKFFGSANDRRVKGYQSRVDAINALEPEIAALSDEALKARTAGCRPSPPCARPPSGPSASAISTSS